LLAAAAAAANSQSSAGHNKGARALHVAAHALADPVALGRRG